VTQKGAVAYAKPTDLSLYLVDVSAGNNDAIWNILLTVASRFLDNHCGQIFYDDGVYVRYFDGEGTPKFDTPPFFARSGTIASCIAGAATLTYQAAVAEDNMAPVSGDVFNLDTSPLAEQVTVAANGVVNNGGGSYTLTLTSGTLFGHATATVASIIQLRLAYFENQPTAQWTAAFPGDGVTPGSAYFLWPRNRPNAGSSQGATLPRPFYGIDIAHIPPSGTTFLPSSIPGYLTISLTANWGWPGVPDLIKDLTCKIAARLWRARESGWSEVLGATDIGVVKMFNAFDPIDQLTLFSSDLILRSL
jgi:hypothetical protein